MNEILFLTAPLIERIWGGYYFKEVLKVTDSEEKIGEMWSASALKEAPSMIRCGKYQGKSLIEVYVKHPELFNFPSSLDFPLLVKLIATSDDLSVQVHPDDAYARKVEHQSGKTEGWLILDAQESSSIVIGHHSKNKEELFRYIQNDDYDHLLCKRKVCPGEFYPIPSGTIHALGKNIVLLEIQQSSNVTYRFYDYHRKDKNGKERELHLDKAIDVTSFEPYQSAIINVFQNPQRTIWKNQYFEVNLYDVDEKLKLENPFDYLLVSVIEGTLYIDGQTLHLGDSFIICHGCNEVDITGKGRFVTTRTL